MFIMKLTGSLVTLFVCMFIGWFYPASSHASALYIDPPTSELFSGDSVTLAVRLNVDEATGECINTIDGTITYPAHIVPVDYSIGDSIIRVWVEEPKINTEERTITFAGGIPNGYCGRIAGDPRLTNNILNLVFRAPGMVVDIDTETDRSKATIGFTADTAVYLNDGLGTRISPTTYSAEISLNSGLGTEIKNPWSKTVSSDNVPPEKFSITLQRDDKTFNGRYYIIFNTVDKQTGISEYQVMEEELSALGSFSWGAANAPWITARSPYVLEDQSLNSVIRVKAIDKAGNQYIATLIPDESLRHFMSAGFLRNIMLFTALGIFLLMVVAIVWVGVRRYIYKRRKSQKQDNSNDQDISDHDQEHKPSE